MKNFVFNSIESLNHACQLDDLSDRFLNLIHNLGFTSFTYGTVRLPTIESDNPVIQTRYNPIWVQRYVEEGYQNLDPVVHQGLMSNMPFNWLDITSRSSNIIREGSEFGHGNGVTVPIHANFGELALLSACAEDTPNELEKIQLEHLPNFQFLAFHYHRRVLELLEENKSSPIHLSPREAEVLQWTAQGKTAWEISEILNLAERTINQYVQSANRKLGVFNKQHAVAKALIGGLITPQ